MCRFEHCRSRQGRGQGKARQSQTMPDNSHQHRVSGASAIVPVPVLVTSIFYTFKALHPSHPFILSHRCTYSGRFTLSPCSFPQSNSSLRTTTSLPTLCTNYRISALWYTSACVRVRIWETETSSLTFFYFLFFLYFFIFLLFLDRLKENII